MTDKKAILNPDEAPEGFYAVERIGTHYSPDQSNVCNGCDARPLCQEDKDDWCLYNRCMNFEIVAFKDGKTYSRKDGCNVVFKRRVQNEKKI